MVLTKVKAVSDTLMRKKKNNTVKAEPDALTANEGGKLQDEYIDFQFL